MRDYNTWVNYEDRILKKLWGVVNYREICIVLRRNHDSLKNRVKILKLANDNKRRRLSLNSWQYWEINIVKKNYGKISSFEISKIVSHTAKSVRYMAVKLGLNSDLDQSTETRIKIGRSISNKIRTDSVYREKIMLAPLRLGKRRSMTLPEKIVFKIIKVCDLNYIYSGNGKKIIADRFCPDFINERFGKIIEVDGDYWHSKPEVILRDRRKFRIYDKMGFKAIRIKESELYKNPQKIIERLISF